MNDHPKVLKNQKTGAFEVLVANDLDHDQSYSLARLEQKHLENLILPLSEIRKKEVDKISKLINIEFIPRVKSNYAHIMHDPRMAKLVEERSSKDLRRIGSVYDYRTDTSLCEHLGIHRYYVGQNNLMQEKKNENNIDPLKQIIAIVPYKGNIFIDYPNKLKYQHIAVTNFTPSANLDMSLPFSCYVKLSIKGEKIPCKLFIKNNDMALVEFAEPKAGQLVAGQFIAFYNRKMDRGKIIASGMVEAAGVFDEWGYNTLPPKGEETEAQENESSKTNHRERLGF